MEAPRKSRYVGVRAQLEELVDDLGINLSRACFHEVNHTFWQAMGRQSSDTIYEVRTAIEEAFMFHIRRWNCIGDVLVVLCASRDILKDTIMMALDVPRPPEADLYLERILENFLVMFVRSWLPRIEDILIENQHRIEVIQRSWRRCASDPSHPICRRRLIHDFEILSKDLESMKV
jgi:hypothetical protein